MTLTEEQKERLEEIRKKHDDGEYITTNLSDGESPCEAMDFLLSLIDTLTSRVKELEEKHNIVCELNNALRQSQKNISEKNQSLQSQLDRVREVWVSLENQIRTNHGHLVLSASELDNYSEEIRGKSE